MVRFGDPTNQIAAVADEEEITLVMMSRYGKMDYIRKVPLGTTTSKVTAQITNPCWSCSPVSSSRSMHAS